MSNYTLSAYLNLQKIKPPAPVSEVHGSISDIMPGDLIEDDAGQTDTKILCDRAYLRGFQEGRSKTLKDGLSDMLALADKIDQRRNARVLPVARELASELNDVVASIIEKLGEEVAMALEPLVCDQIKKNAIQGLAVIVEEKLTAGRGGAEDVITISGNTVLLEALKEQSSATWPDVRYCPSDDPDLKLTMGDLTIVTSLQNWKVLLDG